MESVKSKTIYLEITIPSEAKEIAEKQRIAGYPAHIEVKIFDTIYLSKVFTIGSIRAAGKSGVFKIVATRRVAHGSINTSTLSTRVKSGVGDLESLMPSPVWPLSFKSFREYRFGGLDVSGEW